MSLFSLGSENSETDLISSVSWVVSPRSIDGVSIPHSIYAASKKRKKPSEVILIKTPV